MCPDDADVAIVGGGPAGSAAALTLCRYTRRRVVLIVRRGLAGQRVGETVSGGIAPLLDYLGVQDVLAGAHLPAFGTTAAWGSDTPVTRDFLFTGRGHGWHLDRTRFDTALVDAAERMGAVVLRGASVVSAESNAGSWDLGIGAGCASRIRARQVVDASGRACAIARRAGARRLQLDSLVGFAAFLRCTPDRTPEQAAFIESVPDGWWYSAPVPDGSVVAVFMTDPDGLPAARRDAAAFSILLEAAPRTAARLHGCALVCAPRVRPAGSHRIDPCIGTGWVAAGDAAAAFDPLSSLGIGHALASGIQAARIANGRIDGDEALASAYPADVARHVEAYAAAHGRLYALERRWADRPFWRRRHRGPACVARETESALT